MHFLEDIEMMGKTLIYGVIAACAGVAAFLFAVIAAFLWAQQRYDTIVAAGTAAVIFLLVAVIALIVLAVARKRAARRKAREEAEARAAAPSWLSDPATLLTAFQVARTIGFGKVIPLAIAGIAAFGLLSRKKDSKSSHTSAEDHAQDEQRAA
jgi:heme/copper-type cytochrome/quinol oxidase subunit 2